MSSNSSTVCSSPLHGERDGHALPRHGGRVTHAPGETCAFCARIAFAMSSTEMSKAVSCTGSIHTRSACDGAELLHAPHAGDALQLLDATLRDR
jgi:hypothetical protein